MSDDKPEVECTNCGWQGYAMELLADAKNENRYNTCPECKTEGSIQNYED